jgi:magnesium chelatase family protein
MRKSATANSSVIAHWGKWFDAALERLGLSARAYHRTLRVARTIADLDNGAAALDRHHLAEALQYRRISLLSD